MLELPFKVGEVWTFWFDTDAFVFGKPTFKRIMSHEPWTILEIAPAEKWVLLTILYENNKYVTMVKNNDEIYQIC